MSMHDLLIVDDNANMRRTLKELMAAESFDVLAAGSGEEAVELCRAQKFRLILMDVRMQGIDGVEASRRIRAHSKGTQIVIMSAHAESEMERLALRAGVVAFLRKPIDVEAVTRLITDMTRTLIVCVGYVGSGARALQTGLLGEGVRSSFANSIEEALALTEQVYFDAAVVDMEGLEDAEAGVAAIQDYHPLMPIVLVTSSPDDVPDTLRARVRAVISKPVRADAIADAVGRRDSGGPR